MECDFGWLVLQHGPVDMPPGLLFIINGLDTFIMKNYHTHELNLGLPVAMINFEGGVGAY